MFIAEFSFISAETPHEGGGEREGKDVERKEQIATSVKKIELKGRRQNNSWKEGRFIRKLSSSSQKDFLNSLFFLSFKHSFSFSYRITFCFFFF